MKKSRLFAFVAALGLGVAALSGLSFKSSSIEELSASAGYCSYCGCASDCQSGATGNIYPGYEAM